MAFHEFKGWEHGPADATHFSVQDVGVPWLKVDNEGVYFALFWPRRTWKWVKHEGHAEKHLVDAIVKQPAVEPLGIEVIRGVEAPLPDGWKWPEKATHFSPHCGGFFINEGGDTYLHTGPDWKKFTEVGTLDYWLEDPETIPRYANVNANKPEQLNPAPKKQVGWWS